MTKWLVQHVKKSHSIFDTTLKYRQSFSSLKQSSIHSQNWVHSEQNIFHHIHARCPKWPVKHVKKDQSFLDTTPDYPQWFNFLKESFIYAQNWGLWEQNIIASHTCSMYKWAAKHVKISVSIFDATPEKWLRNRTGFTALSAIHHSTAHTHTPSQFHRTLIAKKSTTVSLSIRNLNSGIWQK